MDKTKIQWTEATWTPIRARNRNGQIGWHCAHASPGCVNCYAEGINKRVGTHFPFKPGHQQNGDVEVFLDMEMLTQPLRWKRPRMIFVCSMTDIFGDFVQDEWIDLMFAVMAIASHHTYQVLTKRSTRMREYFEGRKTPEGINGIFAVIADATWAIAPNNAALEKHWHQIPPSVVSVPIGPNLPNGEPEFGYRRFINPKAHQVGKFLANVWLGVSVEDQQRADERIPDLLKTPAAVRWVSAEPLLGAVDFGNLPSESGVGRFLDSLSNGGCEFSDVPGKLDWIVVGGESGTGARVMHRAWADDIVRQCHESGTKVFVKQLGAAYVDPLSNTYGKYFGMPVSASGRAERLRGDPRGLIRLADNKGGNIDEFPETLKIREWPAQWMQQQEAA